MNNSEAPVQLNHLPSSKERSMHDYNNEYNCVLHGQALRQLQDTLASVHETVNNIRVEVAGTTAQLKAMNGSVTRVTVQVNDHEDWLKRLQSALDTAKGIGTGATKWISAVMVLSNVLVGAVTYIISRR